MKETYVIGIDYGTDSVRALLADAATGETIADSVFSYPRWGRQEYCSPAEARFRQHPQDYLDGLRHVIGEVVAARPDAAPHIRAVSVDTTASTPCLVDRTCTPLALRPEYADDPDAMFVLWKDHTAQREAEEITALCARSEVNYARHSGNHYSAECFWAKCLHLLRGSRRLRRDAYAMVELCDWIPTVLTGADDPSAIRASHCAAGSKQMWAEAWGGFPPEAFFEALDPALLPIVRNISKTNRTCDHAAGTITPAWAQTLELPEGVVVGVGNIDAHAGAVGAGIRCGTVVLNLGTSACHMALMPSDEMGGRLVEGIFGQVDSSIVPGMVGFEAGLSAFGDVYAWFRNLLCWPLEELLVQPGAPDAQARQRLAEECRDKIMGRLTEEAERLEPRADMPLATDWLNGRCNPYPAPELTGTLTGLRLSTTAPEIYYAFAEATAFATKAILDHLAANGVAIERLTGIGGISQKSPFVMQLLADVTGREISVIDCKQACAMGSVVYATVIAGCYGSVEEAQRALCNFPARRYAPREGRHPLLMQRYERYKVQGGLPQR
nr:ribulokinase [Alistipes onderdonkii]